MADPGGPLDCVIALDVGGTSLKGALLDRAMFPVASLRRPTPRIHGPEAVVEAIRDALRELSARAASHGARPVAAGVVVPGIVDERAQRAVYSATLGWRDLPLAALLAESAALPVTLGHDVRAGGIAEARLGAARDVREALFLPIGTGISAAVLVDGRPVHPSAYAGEAGHLVVEPGGRACACGARGCLESIASAAAIGAAYTERTGRTVDGASEVAALVARADAVARAVWDEAVAALATGLAALTSILAPERVVIGGGLSEAGDLLLDPLRAALVRRLTFQRRPQLVRASLGAAAGCLGAGLAAWQSVDTATTTVETIHAARVH